jgi:hypothetical protein
MMTDTAMQHDLVDIIDLQPIPGEYVGCRETSEFTVLGVTVIAFHRYHAMRIAVGQKFGGNCECCGHHLRYAHVTVDQDGEYHCFGRTCLSVETFGEEGSRRLEYSQRVEQKKSGGFCATFNVPQKFWDMPRDGRPSFARPWKGQAMGKRTRQVQWKLSVWGDSFEECLDHCVEVDKWLGLKLS